MRAENGIKCFEEIESSSNSNQKTVSPSLRFSINTKYSGAIVPTAPGKNERPCRAEGGVQGVSNKSFRTSRNGTLKISHRKDVIARSYLLLQRCARKRRWI